jgi:hypothetical protein
VLDDVITEQRALELFVQSNNAHTERPWSVNILTLDYDGAGADQTSRSARPTDRPTVNGSHCAMRSAVEPFVEPLLVTTVLSSKSFRLCSVAT